MFRDERYAEKKQDAGSAMFRDERYAEKKQDAGSALLLAHLKYFN